MPNPNQTFGHASEQLAVEYLRGKGYKILTRNFRTPFGEVDIIARDNDVVVFIEVKARKTQCFGHPKWAVTKAKQRKMTMVAQAYLKKHAGLDTRSRFDVVTIQHTGGQLVIELIANAFSDAYAR